jgi:hypothetical protein
MFQPHARGFGRCSCCFQVVLSGFSWTLKAPLSFAATAKTGRRVTNGGGWVKTGTARTMFLTLTITFACHEHYFDFVTNVIYIIQIERRFNNLKFSYTLLHKISSFLASSGAWKDTIVLQYIWLRICSIQIKKASPYISGAHTYKHVGRYAADSATYDVARSNNRLDSEAALFGRRRRRSK